MPKKQVKVNKKAKSSDIKKKKKRTFKRDVTKKKKRKSEPIQKKSPVTKNNYNMQSIRKTLEQKRIYRTVESTRDLSKIITERSVVKNKGGGYSLYITTKTMNILDSDLEIENGEEATYEYKTAIGLISHFGSGKIWDKDRCHIQCKNNSNRNKEVNFIAHLRTPENDLMQSAGPNYGIERGVMVHQELELFINHGSDSFRKLCPNPNPMTMCIMQALAEKGYVGLFAEYPVYFKGNFGEILASSVDMICFDKTKQRLVIIELKTGYSNGSFFHVYSYDTEHHKNGDPHMFGKFRTLTDCPLNRSKIQLCAYLLFFRSFLHIGCDGEIIHCNGNGHVLTYTIDDGFYYKYSKFIRNFVKFY